jgi:hypothetical protein
MADIDWKAFETAVGDAALSAERKVMDENDETFYAIVFHEFYAESHDRISMPCLAANTLEHLGDRDDARWSSPDWKWAQLPYESAETKKLHRIIERDAASRDVAYWVAIYSRFIDAFVSIAKRMQAKLKAHRRADGDFGIFVFLNGCEDEVEVIQQCTTPAEFKRLFPRLKAELDRRQAIKGNSLENRLRSYRDDLFGHQQEVLALGENAIPMLLEVLQDQEKSWLAADLLGLLGIASATVVDALRARAKIGAELNFHDTIALALLGDVDFLLKLSKSPKTSDAAVRGVCSLYSSLINECRRDIQLDYRPLEAILSVQATRKMVEKELRSSCQIKARDIDEALRGLESKYAAIREHAVLVLGDRQLGKKESERILPALAARLRDRNANVRRLTMIAISRWKKFAKPYAAQMRRLFNDPNDEVASAARHYVKELSS